MDERDRGGARKGYGKGGDSRRPASLLDDDGPLLERPRDRGAGKQR